LPHHKRRDRSLHLDFLEQRQTLSTIAGKSAIIHRVIDQTGRPYAAFGSGVLADQIRQPDGTTLIDAAVRGSSKPFGDFAGQFRITVPAHGPPIVAQAYLITQTGITSRLTITLTTGSDSRTNQEYFGGFTIAAGSGPFGWPGAGTASVQVAPSGHSFTFILKGEYT